MQDAAHQNADQRALDRWHGEGSEAFSGGDENGDADRVEGVDCETGYLCLLYTSRCV